MMLSTDLLKVCIVCAACLGHARRVQTSLQSERDHSISSQSFVELVSASASSPTATSPKTKRQSSHSASVEDSHARGSPPPAYIRDLWASSVDNRNRLVKLEATSKAEKKKAAERRAKEVFDVLSKIADEKGGTNTLMVRDLQELKDQLKVLGQTNTLSSKLKLVKEKLHREGQLDYTALEEILRWLEDHIELPEISWKELIEKHSLPESQPHDRCDDCEDQLGLSLLEQYLAEARTRTFAEKSKEQQGQRTLRALAPSMFFDKFETLFMPSTGPIDIMKKNFALPFHPNLTQINADPPVYAIPGFLSADECAQLVSAANEGEFPEIPYGKTSSIFTGTKWAAAGTKVTETFLQRVRELFDVSVQRFEPITVTRYSKDEYQAKHLDSRLPHQINRNAAYFKTGGQRIAQVIVYLQPPDAGGATKMFNPVFNNLEVQPEVGKALVFPTATLDGEADERYLHSAEPVKAGSKYIVGTWLMEAERTDAADIKNAIKELWKIQQS